MMSNRLQTFVKEHPDFFEEKDGYWRLSSGISDLMERYARAYNKTEFDQLRALVEEAKEKERERLEEDIEKWKLKCAEEQQKAEEIELQLRRIQQGIKTTEQRVEQIKLASKPVPIPPRSWYHSGVVFLTLALSGVFFLYLGLILSDQVSMSYLFGGFTCLAFGLYLQSGNSKLQPVPEGAGQYHAGAIKAEQGAIKIARIKSATLMERKRIANQTIATFNHEIHRSNAKLNTISG